MIDLPLQIVGMIVAKPFGQDRADQAADSSHQACRNSGSENRSAGNDDRASSNGRACINQGRHYASLSVSNCFRRDICRSRNGRVVCKSARADIDAAELFVHSILTSEQAQFRSVEARAQELIDCRLKVAFVRKNSDSFPKSSQWFVHDSTFDPP